MHSENNYIGISIIVVRKGKIRGTKTHLVKKAFFESIDSIYEMAILNFYNSQLDIPNKVLCTHALESKGLISKVLKKKFKKFLNLETVMTQLFQIGLDHV